MLYRLCLVGENVNACCFLQSRVPEVKVFRSADRLTCSLDFVFIETAALF